jgi:UDP-glucose 4-epimerase
MTDISNKKVVVTGGAGFIGSNLVDELIKRGADVAVIDNLSTGKKENLNPKAKFYEVDIRDFAKLKPLFKGVDYVFHLAALARVQESIEDPIKYNDVNVNGTLNVLKAAKDNGVKRVVYSAYCAAYGDQTKMPIREDASINPISPYGLQKYVGELYCKMFADVYKLGTVSLRYFNVYGPRQSFDGPYSLVMGIFLRQRLNGEPMTIVGDGEQKRDYVSVFDIVNANILAATGDKVGNGEVINIGTGKNYTVNDLAKMIGGKTVNLSARLEPREILADNTKAREFLGWEPKVNLVEWVAGYKKEIGLK